MPIFLSLRALAAETGVSDNTLRRWRRNGWLLPCAVCGTREKFTVDAVMEAGRRSLGATDAKHTAKPRATGAGKTIDYEAIMKQVTAAAAADSRNN